MLAVRVVPAWTPEDVLLKRLDWVLFMIESSANLMGRVEREAGSHSSPAPAAQPQEEILGDGTKVIHIRGMHQLADVLRSHQQT